MRSTFPGYAIALFKSLERVLYKTAFTNEDHIEYEFFYWELGKKVTSAKVQSSTATAPLNEEALRKARISTFTQGTNDAESGTITYNFRLR